MKVMIMLISHVESQRWPFNNTQLTKKCMLSVRTKKNNNNDEKANNNFKHPSPIGKEVLYQLWNSCPVSFLTLFSIFFSLETSNDGASIVFIP